MWWDYFGIIHYHFLSNQLYNVKQNLEMFLPLILLDIRDL